MGVRTTDLSFTTTDLGSNTELVIGVSYNGVITTQKQNYRIGDYGELLNWRTFSMGSMGRCVFFL